MKIKLLASFLGLAAASFATLAQPSGGFYQLKDRDSGKILCSQHLISPDWVRQSGPYRDAHCTIHETPVVPRANLPTNPLDLAPKK